MFLNDPAGVTFASKRDAWIVLLIWAGALLAIFAGVTQLSGQGSVALSIIVFLALVSVAGFMLWILYTTRYTIGAELLVIRSGPFRFRVPLNEIDSVRPSRNPLSSPACSLDRLLIQWRVRRRILVSPDAKEEFLRELKERCSQLEFRDLDLERTEVPASQELRSVSQ